MADPSFIIEQAVRTFLQQWYSGLQPSLNLKTLSSGAVCVNFNVASVTQFEKQRLSHYQSRRKSGQNSRILRQIKRQSVLAPELTVRKNSQEQEVQNIAIEPSSLPTNYDSVLLSSSLSSETSAYQDKQQSSVGGIDKAVQSVHSSVVDVACETDVLMLKSKKLALSIVKNTSHSIPPKRIYHPAIINASKSFYGKNPDELSRDEMIEFKFYLDQKKEIGDPVETSIIFQPSSMRDCLHCGYPT